MQNSDGATLQSASALASISTESSQPLSSSAVTPSLAGAPPLAIPIDSSSNKSSSSTEAVQREASRLKVTVERTLSSVLSVLYF